jgi:hypothetical protein
LYHLPGPFKGEFDFPPWSLLGLLHKYAYNDDSFVFDRYIECARDTISSPVMRISPQRTFQMLQVGFPDPFEADIFDQESDSGEPRTHIGRQGGQLVVHGLVERFHGPIHILIIYLFCYISRSFRQPSCLSHRFQPSIGSSCWSGGSKDVPAAGRLQWSITRPMSSLARNSSISSSSSCTVPVMSATELGTEKTRAAGTVVHFQPAAGAVADRPDHPGAGVAGVVAIGRIDALMGIGHNGAVELPGHAVVGAEDHRRPPPGLPAAERPQHLRRAPCRHDQSRFHGAAVLTDRFRRPVVLPIAGCRMPTATSSAV